MYKRTRLKDFEGQRLILQYRTAAGHTNQQQGIITYVGKDYLNFNIGNKEFPIRKSNIINLQDNKGNLLFETKI